jgi:hypothetical protein
MISPQKFSLHFIGLHPAVRGNTDISIVFPLKSASEKQAFQEQYLDFLPKAVAYSVLQNFIGKDKDTSYFLAIDNRNRLSLPEELCLYQGHADPPPPFIMGGRDYWGNELSEYQESVLRGYEDLHAPRTWAPSI